MLFRLKVNYISGFKHVTLVGFRETVYMCELLARRTIKHKFLLNAVIGILQFDTKKLLNLLTFILKQLTQSIHHCCLLKSIYKHLMLDIHVHVLVKLKPQRLNRTMTEFSGNTLGNTTINWKVQRSYFCRCWIIIE